MPLLFPGRRPSSSLFDARRHEHLESGQSSTSDFSTPTFGFLLSSSIPSSFDLPLLNLLSYLSDSSWVYMLSSLSLLLLLLLLSLLVRPLRSTRGWSLTHRCWLLQGLLLFQSIQEKATAPAELQLFAVFLFIIILSFFVPLAIVINWSVLLFAAAVRFLYLFFPFRSILSLVFLLLSLSFRSYSFCASSLLLPLVMFSFFHVAAMVANSIIVISFFFPFHPVDTSIRFFLIHGRLP